MKQNTAPRWQCYRASLTATPTQQTKRAEVLAALVEQYEATHYPIDPPHPIEAIKFRMEQEGLTVKDMGGIIGKPNRVYEVFNGTRPLTLAMIRRLHEKLGIPADILIQA